MTRMIRKMTPDEIKTVVSLMVKKKVSTRTMAHMIGIPHQKFKDLTLGKTIEREERINMIVSFIEDHE